MLSIFLEKPTINPIKQHEHDTDFSDDTLNSVCIPKIKSGRYLRTRSGKQCIRKCKKSHRGKLKLMKKILTPCSYQKETVCAEDTLIIPKILFSDIEKPQFHVNIDFTDSVDNSMEEHNREADFMNKQNKTDCWTQTITCANVAQKPCAEVQTVYNFCCYENDPEVEMHFATIIKNPLFEHNMARSNYESEKAETYVKMEVIGATESIQNEKFENEDLSILNDTDDTDSKFILYLQDPDFDIFEATIVKNEALYNEGECVATNLEKNSETCSEYVQVCSISV